MHHRLAVNHREWHKQDCTVQRAFHALLLCVCLHRRLTSLTCIKIEPWMHRSLCVGVILCLISAIGVGSVFRTVEYRMMKAKDEQRLLWVTGMVQSEWWVHECVFACT